MPRPRDVDNCENERGEGEVGGNELEAPRVHCLVLPEEEATIRSYRLLSHPTRRVVQPRCLIILRRRTGTRKDS